MSSKLRVKLTKWGKTPGKHQNKRETHSGLVSILGKKNRKNSLKRNVNCPPTLRISDKKKTKKKTKVEFETRKNMLRSQRRKQ